VAFSSSGATMRSTTASSTPATSGSAGARTSSVTGRLRPLVRDPRERLADVAAPAVEVRLGARGRHQHVEDPVHLVRVARDRGQRLAPLGLGALPALEELHLGHHARQRRAQLVRQLGRQALLVAQARREPVEEAVERGRELAELVGARLRPEPAPEVALAPLGRRARHLPHRVERAADGHPGEREDGREQHPRQRERAQQRDLAGALVGLEGLGGHDGADLAPVGRERRSEHPEVIAQHVDEHVRPPGHRVGVASEAALALRADERPAAFVDPHAAVDRLVVRRARLLLHREPAVRAVHHRRRGGRLDAQPLLGVGVEAPREQDVEGHREGGQRQERREHRERREAPAQRAEARHCSR
jgi:hypothetical protein